jgi:FkbM family methyltransferase
LAIVAGLLLQRANQMTGTLSKKLHSALEVRKTYRNWPLWFFNRWGLRWPSSSVRITIGAANLVGPNNAETWGTVDQIWRQRVYTKHFPILEGYRVLDIGAHFGFFSMFAAFQGKDVKIVSYEPSSRNFGILQENVTLNAKHAQIQAFNCALGDSDGCYPLYKPRGHDDSGTLFEGNLRQNSGRAASEMVQVKKADGIWDLYDRYDFAKLDCEGAEFPILKSLGESIKRFRYLAIEYHSDPERMKSFLYSNGFSVLATDPASVASWCTFPEMGMLYASNNEF